MSNKAIVKIIPIGIIAVCICAIFIVSCTTEKSTRHHDREAYVQATQTPASTPRATTSPKPTSTPKATSTPKPTSTPKATTTPKPTSTPKATTTPKPTSTPKPSGRWYSEGMYKVGVDIPAGEYYVKSTGSYGAYFAVSKDSSGTLDSIIANGTFETFTFVTVENGQYFEVSDAKFITAKKAPEIKPKNGVYGEGMYRVGKDIQAGEYKLTCTSEYGAYYAVLRNSKHVLDSIISNSLFEGTKYVTVKEGQYIEISGAKMIMQ